MKFGYFTLSDNAYPNNPRTASQFVREIREQAVLAETLGFHSAWVGEHHFDTLGVNSRPDLVLTSVAAVTERIRLAPAVSVLPLHHPIHVAECWATLDVLSEGRVDFACGRGYDSREYEAFNAEFMASAEIFEECMDIIWKAWTSDGPWSHVGTRHTIKDMAITPKPVQNCEANGNTPGRAICSYFIHIANSAEEEDRAREAQMSYFKHCVLPAFPNDPDKAPPTMQYFMKIVDILKNMGKEDLTDKSILLGPPAQIIDTLKRVEAAGIDEVILYFNVGNKPHEVVKEQMGRFAEEIAPAFADLGLRTNAE